MIQILEKNTNTIICEIETWTPHVSLAHWFEGPMDAKATVGLSSHQTKPKCIIES